MLRCLIILCIIYATFAVPVVPKKKPDEEKLRKQLGEEGFKKLQHHLAGEKFQYVKNIVHKKPEERPAYVESFEHERAERKHHEAMFEPGSSPQLHEVWRDEDRMDDSSYSPKLLFKKHDLDGDDVLDEHEINALVEHEIEKVYKSGRSAEEDELRDLEMNRMMNAFLERMDRDGDGHVTLHEFLNPMQDDDGDDEWEPLTDLEDDLPEFGKKTDDKNLLEYAQKQVELHPDDAEIEEVMHILHGVKANPTQDTHSQPSYIRGGASLHNAPPPVPPIKA